MIKMNFIERIAERTVGLSLLKIKQTSIVNSEHNKNQLNKITRCIVNQTQQKSAQENCTSNDSFAHKKRIKNTCTTATYQLLIVLTSDQAK